MFRTWIAKGGDWLETGYTHNLVSRNTDSTNSANKLYTRDELLVKFHNNISLVDELVNSKVERKEFIDHPDLPGVEEARLYFVL